MAGDKRTHDVIRVHHVGYFARENGLTPDLERPRCRAETSHSAMETRIS